MASSYVFRKDGDTENPNLTKLVGLGITRGLDVVNKKNHTGTRTGGITVLSEGARFDGDTHNGQLIQFSFKGFVIPEFENGVRNWRYHDGRMPALPDYKTVTANHTTNTFTTATPHGLENSANADEKYRIIAEGAASTNPKVPANLVDEKQAYYIVNKTSTTFQLSLEVGGAAEDFTDNGSGVLRVYRANAGFDDPFQGRPEFFPDLDLCFSGMSYVEWIIPQRFANETSFDDLRFILEGKEFYDFEVGENDEVIFDVIGGAHYSTNPALVALDTLVNDGKIAPTFEHLGVTFPRFRGQSWKEYQLRCDANLNYVGGNDTEGYMSFPTSTNWEQLTRTAGLLKTNTVGHSCAFGRAVLQTEKNSSIEISANVGQLKVGWHTNNADLNPSATCAILLATSGKIYKSVGATNTEIGTWTSADRIKVAIENRVFKAYLNDVPLPIGNILAPESTLYAFVHGSEGTNAQVSQTLFSPVGTTGAPLQVKRHTAHLVFSQPQLVQTATEAVFERTPGVEWQDVNGGLKVLSNPVRDPVYLFKFSAEADEDSNILVAGCTITRTPPEQRYTYYRAVIRDSRNAYLKLAPIDEDRKAYRESLPGAPLIDQGLLNFGVMNQSEGNRLLKYKARMQTDLPIQCQIQAFFDSYLCARGDYVEVADDVPGYTIEDPVMFMVEDETSRFENVPYRDFALRVMVPNAYSDTDQGVAVPHIPTVPNDYLRPAPILADLTLEQSNEMLLDGTWVHSVAGVATFQPFANQRARIYWRKPDGEIFHFTAEADNETFTTETAHQLQNDDAVAIFENLDSFTEFNEGTVYYVKNRTATTFKLSDGSDGTVKAFNTDFDGFVHSISDFQQTSQTLYPDDTNTAAFELFPAVRGVHIVRVMTQNQLGVSFPFSAQVTRPKRINLIDSIPQPPYNLTGLFDGVNVTFSAFPSPSQFTAGYKVTDETGRIIRQFLTQPVWTETATQGIMRRRLYAVSSVGGVQSTEYAETAFVVPPIVFFRHIQGAGLDTHSTLIKTAVNGWGNCGAVLNYAILTDKVPARLRFTADRNDVAKVFGFCRTTDVNGLEDFLFAIYLKSDGGVMALYYDSGVQQEYIDAYEEGSTYEIRLTPDEDIGEVATIQIFKVTQSDDEITGGRQQLNYEMLYTFSELPVYAPLYCGVALYTQGTTFPSHLQISGSLIPTDISAVTFQNMLNCNYTAGVLTATNFGGASTVERIPANQDGEFRFKLNPNDDFTVGLNTIDIDTDDTNIPFALHFTSVGEVFKYEDGVQIGGQIATVNPATDVFSLSRENSILCARKNGQLIATYAYSDSFATQSLLLDISFYAAGCEMSQIGLRLAYETINDSFGNRIAVTTTLENPAIGRNTSQSIPEFNISDYSDGKALVLMDGKVVSATLINSSEIGVPVIGGTPGSILHIDSSGELAELPTRFFMDFINKRVSLESFDLYANSIRQPQNLTVTPSSGGSFAAGTYRWCVLAVDIDGGVSSYQYANNYTYYTSLTLNQKATLNWTATAGAVYYQIYRNPTGDNANWKYIANSYTNSYVDDGSIAGTTNSPYLHSTAKGKIVGRNGIKITDDNDSPLIESVGIAGGFSTARALQLFGGYFQFSTGAVGGGNNSLLRVYQQLSIEGTDNTYYSRYVFKGYYGDYSRFDLNPREGYLVWDGANTATFMKLFPNVGDVVGAIAYLYDTYNSLTHSTAKHTSWKVQGVEKAYLKANGTYRSIALERETGTSSQIAKVGGVIFDHITDASGGIEKAPAVLYSDTIPANTLAQDREKLVATYCGIFEASGNLKYITLEFGGVLIFDSTGIDQNGGSWELNVSIIRVESDIVRTSVKFTRDNYSTVQVLEVGVDTGLSNDLELIADSAVGSEVTVKFGFVEWKPAA